MGPTLGIVLLVLTVFFRGLVDVGIGFWTNLVTYVFLIGFISLFYKRFLIVNRHRKALWAILFSLVPSIVWIAVYLIEQVEKSFIIYFGAVIIPILGAVIIIYTIESVREKLVYRTQMVRAEKLEVASHLSASISHEVRNPLTVTRGFLQLLLEQSLTDENRIKFSKIAIKELDRAEGIISDYLTFAKPTIEKKEHLVVKDEIKHVMEIIIPLINMNSVELELDTKENDLKIVGDKNKFHQCILNILKNSVEAMPNGGKLIISIWEEEKDVIIQINDTGVGMTQQQVQRLGEPYFSNKGIKGTGLGMMVTFSIVRAMKGTIQFNSKVTEGTTVHLKFPLVK